MCTLDTRSITILQVLTSDSVAINLKIDGIYQDALEARGCDCALDLKVNGELLSALKYKYHIVPKSWMALLDKVVSPMYA